MPSFAHLAKYLRGWIAALSCLVAAPVVAQDWQAVVIGQSGPTAPRAFGDAFHAAEAFRKGGIDVVQVLRDRPFAEVQAALGALEPKDPAVIYLTGPLTPDGAGVRLDGGTLQFQALMTQLAGAGLTQAALLIESCPGDQPLVVPEAHPSVQMLRAASVAPSGVCPTDGARLTDQLRNKVTQDTPLAEVLSDVWVSTDLARDLVLRAPAPVVAPVVRLSDTPVVSLTPVAPPTATTATIAPVSFQSSVPASVGEVVIFSPTPQSQQAAVPRAAGLPEPSIIVGLIEDATLASFSPAETPGEVTSTEISYENLEARRALRAQDAALFRTLVGSGAFDPPEQLLPVALQTELARMGCYRAGIDGQWGGGSRSSVTRYFSEIEGEDAVTLDPTVSLFRQIVLQDDVVCPAPVAAARTTTTRRTTAATPRRTTRQTTTRRAAPAPARKPAPKRTISTGTSLGVFR
ncbi:hypothetical protein [Sulfitobacter noctilucae]|uniref:hypothetical protein n=1 Tax=Sulfitobacter noctilucae TaxID=1342302 RepID=UPI000561427E|nr:hypothetical protein [Sulfitobacter noctilucae]